jgi:hypothetical protein
VSFAHPRRIAWFVSGHGFGHGVRATVLLNALPPDVEVTFYTTLPESFFRENSARNVRIVACELDCGCVQPDTISVDILATLQRYAAIEGGRAAILPPLVERLKDEGTELVVGDIPPLCFPLAREAALPSLALCNFSWLDIYEPYVRKYPAYRPLLDRMRADYQLADKHLRFVPFFGESLAPDTEELGLVCRTGSLRRSELARLCGLDERKKWCLVYVGKYGLAGIPWARLAELDDWEFLGLDPLDGAPGNYHRLFKDPSLGYADFTASADLVVGKLGYSLVCECLTAGTPILFLRCDDFAESAALAEVVLERNLGRELPLSDLKTLHLRPHLDRAQALEPRRMRSEGVAKFLSVLYPGM